MNNYFIMNRTGEFTPSKHTENQCKVEGHTKYFYHLVLVFDGAVKLNYDAFIVDHQELDSMITDLDLKGSCEEMHQKIAAHLIPMLEDDKELPLLACKCTIRPTKKDGPAWLEYVSLKAPAYAACLALT
jgi:hypothetical protein